MKSIKLLVSLVTLHILGGLPLVAAEAHAFRIWTDNTGRQIKARLLSVEPQKSVRIEREDGNVFNLAITRFSQADRDYIKTATEKTDDGDKSPTGALVDADDAQWQKLRLAGSQPASVYDNTALNDVIADINRRLRAKKVTTENGEPVSIRTEPADLANDLQITGQMPSMGTVDFLKRIAYNYNLALKTDSLGGLVLIDKNAGAPSSFFGVKVN